MKSRRDRYQTGPYGNIIGAGEAFSWHPFADARHFLEIRACTINLSVTRFQSLLRNSLIQRKFSFGDFLSFRAKREIFYIQHESRF